MRFLDSRPAPTTRDCRMGAASGPDSRGKKGEQMSDQGRRARNQKLLPIARRLVSIVQPLATALGFLTILPAPGLSSSEQRIAPAIAWFPVVGAIIGLLLVAVGWPAGIAWDAGVRAACIVVAWGIITSGLHLDGLGDTFDGVMSWRPRERKLEIMRDSTIGAMGLLAVVAVLLLKVAWLQAADTDWWRAALLAPVWGRWASVYGLCRFPAARPGGLGQAFHAQSRRRSLFVATAVAVLLAVIIGQVAGLIAGLLVWGGTHLLARWWTRALGGLTGDTYGALCEIGEVIVLATLAV